MRVALLVLLLAAVWGDGAGDNQNDSADCKPLTLNNVVLTPLPQAVVQVADDLDMEPSQDPREMLQRYSSEAMVAAVYRHRQTTVVYLVDETEIREYVVPTNPNAIDIHWRNLLDSVPEDSAGSWSSPFLDCLTGRWLFGYTTPLQGGAAGIFFPLERLNIDRCNESFGLVFGGIHNCDRETAQCIPVEGNGLRRGYTCSCRPGYFLPTEYQAHGHQIYKCRQCPEGCQVCGSPETPCMASYDYLLRTAVLGVQIMCMCGTVVLAVVVFKQRKCKTIATGMWTILETILLGTLLLYSTVVVRFFKPSVEQCLVEPWCRELGFVICYGAIILKLYRILIEFRTRKAHRWVVRDKDLLKYLLGMVIVVFGYMAAWTATNLNFIQENYNVLTMGTTHEGLQFLACKALWWDYVTETGEILILIFGIHLSYACRNATTQFQERRFLCLAIVVEATVSGTFYILRIIYSSTLHPDYSFLAYFCRSQLTSTVVLLVIFTPKLWYQHKQIRDSRSTRHYLPHEYSCRLPVDAFKPQDGITGTNSSDVDVGEINLADMNPEDIRAELKRLYTQLEVLKNKTIRADNPHISKRRGGRKVAHRRFSLQKKGSREKALHHRHQRCSMRHHGMTGGDGRGHDTGHDPAEGEVSRTPEDSVCSLEGPSAIYNDGPSTYSEYGTPYRKQ